MTGKCTYNATLGIVNTTSFNTYISVDGNIAAMESAVSVKPNSVAIEADTSMFQSYSGGIISATAGCGTTIDHAV